MLLAGIVCAAIGVICIVLGLSHRKGNISSLHEYHRKRVTEADRLPFGKLVGLGTIIVGVSLIVMGGFYGVARFFGESPWVIIGTVSMAVGMTLGMGISFYAMIKYNKGIF